MRSIEENKLSSYLSLRQVCEENRSKWMVIPAFLDGYNRFNANVEEIMSLSEVQLQSIKGVTLDKIEIKESLLTKALFIGKAVYAYAEVEKKRELQEAVHFTRSVLERVRDTDCHSSCEVIYLRATEVIAQLGNYGVSNDALVELKQLLDAYEVAIGSPRKAVAKRKDASVRISELIKETDTVLKRILDKLVDGFKETHPSFHNQYFITREVLDYGRKHTTLAGVVKDKRTNKPLEKVEVSISYMENEEERIEKTFTDKEGAFFFEHVQAREYEVRCLIAGYVTGIEKSDIRRGKTNRIEVGLERSRIA